jgi:hypothetical protein
MSEITVSSSYPSPVPTSPIMVVVRRNRRLTGVLLRSPFSGLPHLPTSANSAFLRPYNDANKFSTHTSDGAIILKLIS